MITITKVVTKNFFMDFIARIQNFLGMNIRTYEKMLDKAVDQIKEELVKTNIKMKWFRYEITQLTNGALAVMMYGEKEGKQRINKGVNSQ